ncbi:SDR family NAD(P)-dependent oxidoreductase, partial [Myxococcota bacterium]|nr:SDR family NAD(P)-dependent oxidoreductase [Myxococcota bacterium]
MSTAFPRALIVGASSGIGATLALKLAASGAKVAAVARRQTELDALAAQSGGKILPYAGDVLDYVSTPALFDRIVEDLSGLDLFIYNAGVMPPVEESEYNFDKDRQMLEVNLVAAVQWSNLAGAHFEAARSGVLCGISSVAGERGRRGSPVYTASKAGLTAYLEAMRNRLTRYGVRVVTIKPGPVQTPMTAGLKLPLMIPAERAADEIISALEGGAIEAFVPAIWRPIMFVVRNVPSF